MMGYLNDENNIINMLQSVSPSAVYFPMENEDIINVFESIYRPENWKNWLYCAGKADPPPDFYSKRELEREIYKTGILDVFSQAQLIINAKTELPTIEDHNYIFY